MYFMATAIDIVPSFTLIENLLYVKFCPKYCKYMKSFTVMPYEAGTSLFHISQLKKHQHIKTK